MNYELENKLRDKIDKWELHALKETIRNLEFKIGELKETIGRNETRMSNQVYAIQQLAQAMLDRNLLPEDENILIELKNYIW